MKHYGATVMVKRFFLYISCVLIFWASLPQVMGIPNSGQQRQKAANQPKKLHFKTIHGDLLIEDPLIIELIESPLMQRLKTINQYGADEYLRPKKKYAYNRFDHSLGVYQILKQHGASRQEQVAGLLHDASHTVFSHTTDFLFMGGMNKGAYQDTIHEVFLEKYGAKEILARHGLTVADIIPHLAHFRMLEQSSPALCADRIEYIIHAGDLENILSPEEIQEMHQSLHFKEGDWYFDDVNMAEKFANIALDQTLNTWGSPQSVLTPQFVGKAIAHLLNTGIISRDDIHFNLSDQQLWEMLDKSQDPIVQELVTHAKDIDARFRLLNDEDIKQDLPHEILHTKFRGVDPFVRINGKNHLLTTLSPRYRKAYADTKNLISKGWTIQRIEGTTAKKAA